MFKKSMLLGITLLFTQICASQIQYDLQDVPCITGRVTYFDGDNQFDLGFQVREKNTLHFIRWIGYAESIFKSDDLASAFSLVRFNDQITKVYFGNIAISEFNSRKMPKSIAIKLDPDLFVAEKTKGKDINMLFDEFREYLNDERNLFEVELN